MNDLNPAEQAAVDTLEENLRKIGIYPTTTDMIRDEDGSRYLLLDCNLGDYAFSDKVQHPAKAAADRTLREMGIDLGRTDFADARERVRRNLAAGRPAMDDDDG